MKLIPSTARSCNAPEISVSPLAFAASADKARMRHNPRRRPLSATAARASFHELKGRGAGIGTPKSVIQSLKERDLIDADMPYFDVEKIPHVGRTDEGDRLGHTPWTIPMAIELLNWGDLYTNLRKRVPEEVYCRGCQVTDVFMAGNEKAVVVLDDGREFGFDLVICADGYHSMGRQILFPEVEMDYRGYVLWRGVLEERYLEDTAPLEGKLERVGYDEGHGVFYFVPGPDGSAEKGRRWVNWAVYIRVPEENLADFLTDANGKVHDGSLPPGAMPLAQEATLKQLARERLPGYYADIIVGSEDTFAQAIYIVTVPAYRSGRICLAGDAGAVAPPFTGSGVFKGMHNAIDLTEALASHNSVDAALEEWNAKELINGRKMTYLGERLEEALIWSIPDFSTMNEAAMREWWTTAASYPQDMFEMVEEK